MHVVDDTSGPDAVRAVTRSGVSRLRILDLLRQTPAGLGVQDLADRMTLHGNTVRFHLDRLVAEGLVQRHAEERTEPGRPRLTFTATAAPDVRRDQRSYRLLAEILASFVTGAVPDAAEAATEAGRTWGRYLTETPAPYRKATEEESLSRLLRTLDDIGFAPELAKDEGQRKVLLRHCPFLEVAEEHRDVVCSIHLGLMQGTLAEMRSPLTTGYLVPFAEPSLCVAHLTKSVENGGTGTRGRPRSSP